MEEPQALQINLEEESYGDEFYENLEAPKFVDLTKPDRYQAGDDRYWFCLRVGCDQKHEEEMDSEAIYKNFVLRVMAARSPNIQRRKALYKKDSSAIIKCPQTVPAKPSKSRISRMALVSSISKRTVDPKVKVKPHSKQSATPNVKAKQSSVVVAKALTTPRSKKIVSNLSAFRSVRNPGAPAVLVPKNRVVAKALVFHSPKKSARTKTSVELNTPLETLCSAMKKLEITSRKKNLLGHNRPSVELNTPLKSLCSAMKKLEITNGKMNSLGYNRPLPSDTSRKQPRGREVKSRVYDGLHSQHSKGEEVTSSKCLKRKKKEENLEQCQDSPPHEGLEKDFIDIKIDEKSRHGSPKVCSNSTSDEGDVHEENLKPEEVSKTSMDEKVGSSLSDIHGSDSNSLPNSEERNSGVYDTPQRQALEKGNEMCERRDEEEKRKSSSENGTTEIMKSGDKRHEKQNDGEGMESDDKENVSASDENRELDVNTGCLERKVIGKHKNSKGQKIIREMRKPSKENPLASNAGAQGLKNRKTKPTNPKPFRLRTDERKVLKEANSERKLHIAPLKEVTSVPRFPSQKKSQNTIQRNDKYLEKTKHGEDPSESSETETSRKQTDTQNGPSSLKTSIQRGRKLSTTPQRHTVSSQQKLVTPKQDKSAEKLQRSLKRTRSPFLRQFAKPQEAAPRMKEMVSIITPGRLGAIKETSPTILGPKGSEVGISPNIQGSTSSASRPSLQGKRFTTIPKEPNFHAIHVPKSCTRRVA